MTAAAWLAVAAAVLVVPLGRPVRVGAGSRGGSDGGRNGSGGRSGPVEGFGGGMGLAGPGLVVADPAPRRTDRLLVPAAAVSVGACCLLLLDPVRGAVAAALLCPAAGFAARALLRVGAARSRRAASADPGLPLVLDLTAAALRAGRTPADALAAAAPAAPANLAADFTRVAGLLRLGALPARAWQALAADEALAPVATVAVRSAGSGARLAAAFERLAGELRAENRARSAARAQRVGVLAMAPLGACFLPSFVVLGVVPVVVGIARTVLSGLP